MHADTFQSTLQKTNLWLGELGQELGWDDSRRAYRALRATLHALRDRLTVEETAHLGAQLPMLIRGIYYEGWNPTGKPLKERHIEEFLGHIEDELNPDLEANPEDVARGVFRLLSRRISAGEVQDIKHVLPRPLRTLWP